MNGSVYLDACMIIDLVEGVPDLQRTLRTRLQGRNLVSTELARLESRIGALRQGQARYLETYRQFFDGCDTQPMNRDVFDLATDLRVQHAIKTPDALHLAAALLSSCGEFWTDDKRLAAAAQGRIRIVALADLSPLTGTPSES